MKYPVGIQTFAEIRHEGYVYVDKTAYISKLLDESKYIFLSRPRRFGKSLTLSMLDAYFSGRKDLFEGLAIADIETEWKKHPVLRIDFNTGMYANAEGLRNLLHATLIGFEKRYGQNPELRDIPSRFRWIIEEAHRQTGEKVVILIDEYEKPILEAIGDRELQDEFRAVLKPFYGCLKTCDEHIRFAMLTGVTKYGHLSVFSDLNNISDISLTPKFAAICGITHQELQHTFAESIHEFAETEGVSDEELFNRLVAHYDSYRFSRKDLKVFNPYSVLNALRDQDFKDFWFMSGTPSFLVRLIRNKRIMLPKLEEYDIMPMDLYNVDSEYSNPIPVLYQSGYLTIKGYDSEREMFRLGYPNREVRFGFLRNLLALYNGQDKIDNTTTLMEMEKAALSGHPEVFMRKVKAVLVDVAYGGENTRDEFWLRDMVYLMLSLLGYRIQVEKHISTGRIDCVVEVAHYVYVIEFKYDKSPEEALAQIEEKGYALPFEGGNRKVYKIGANYNPATRQIDCIIKP